MSDNLIGGSKRGNGISNNIARRGLMLVLSSPSGAGKSSIANLLINGDQHIKLSVSLTTRTRREGEIEGFHYYFVDEQTFIKKRDNGELLEWARVFNNLYGTPKSMVEDELSRGRDVLFDIDWQGTQQLHEKARNDLVRIFILPPSITELNQRLSVRGLDHHLTIADRMYEANSEISHWAEYDYVVINNDLDRAAADVQSILNAERLRRERQVGLADFVRKMQRPL